MTVNIIRINTLEDERLRAYTRLTERELRSVLEPEQGIFIAESAKVIERALAAGMSAMSFLMGERWLDSLSPLLKTLNPDIPIFVADMELMEQLTGFSVTRGALAAFRRPPLLPAADFLASLARAKAHPPLRVCVLEGIVDHTNVGAIFRSAAALNVDGILVSPNCCDPLYRRAVRVSMGTVFQIPWTRIGNTINTWPGDGMRTLKAEGFLCAALALSDTSYSLDMPQLQDIERLALFMGSEGYGLSPKTIAQADMCVRIPMAHGVDSLNVAAASAVAFWQLCPHVSNEYSYRAGLFS
ncbi:RNA methyltransferase [Collinsella sp. zg1085]|uniref:TrmH family RNA methyltransferase n=1 Tax=Collinsella sp. zg1085 TaxID=2844380 RepID=UPI001C0D7970|nr:RNA methyltransferase [Collinsella sp. zg1085]QWT18296.1 RNA methyltransferase [Collinsella sp. zg1085]